MIRGLIAAACSRSAGSSAATGVQYVAMTEGAFVTSSSSTVATPAGVQSADALLCVLMHRSAVTPPSGWVLLATRDVLGSVAPDHAVSVYRMSSPASGTYTWTQAVSDRMKVVYALLRSSQGTVLFSGASFANKTDSDTALHQLPSVTAAASGELHLQCSTCVYSPGGTYQSPSGSTSVSGGSIDANSRLGVAYKMPAMGESSGGSFLHVDSSGNNLPPHDGAELTLVFSPGA